MDCVFSRMTSTSRGPKKGTRVVEAMIYFRVDAATVESI